MQKISNFFLGEIIYKIFFHGREGSQLPLSILNARLNLYGHYAGASFAQEIAKRRSERQKHKIIGVLKNAVIFALSICFLFYLQYIPKESYYYGLSQELVASLIFFFLLLYVIPKKISKESEVKIGLSYFLVHCEGPNEIYFYLTNLGSRAIQPSDVHCELLFGEEIVVINPVPDYLVQNCAPAYEVWLNHVSIKLNDTLFPGQRHLVSKVKTPEDQIIIYFRILTVDRIVPDFSKTTPYLFIQKEDTTLPGIEEYGEIVITFYENEFYKEYLVR